MDPGIPRINAEALRKACVENRGFELPELNEVLILHYHGFRKIENLDDTWKKWRGRVTEMQAESANSANSANSAFIIIVRELNVRDRRDPTEFKVEIRW